jgi:cytochrome P450
MYSSEELQAGAAAVTPFDPAVQRCPFGFYAKLQAESPVYRDPQSGFWMIARYDLLKQAAADVATFSSFFDMRKPDPSAPPTPEELYMKEHGWLVQDFLTQADPPVHTRYRALVNRIFTPVRVKAMRPYVEALIDELMAKFIDKGRCDFAREFAVPFPMTVIADQLGVPRADGAKFKFWSDTMISTLGLMLTPAQKLEAAKHIVEFHHYLVARFEEARAASPDTIIRDLVRAELDDPETGPRPLSTMELLSISQQLLVAGNETTSSSLMKGLRLLIDRPDVADELRADPSLIPNFVEEMLRIDSPVQNIFRKTTRDVELGGVTIPARSIVLLTYGAANRDEAKFPNADRLDIRRENAKMHVAFGSGIHHCVGAPLAKANMILAFGKLLAQMDAIALDPAAPAPAHVPNIIVRGLDGLSITFKRRSL